MTDSLTSLYLVNGYLVRPHQFCYHKHRWLVAAIAQNLLSRTASVRLTKVRAHIGVSGNEAADALATQAHDHSHAESAFVDPDSRGPAWVQCLHGDKLSDLDELCGYALKCASTSFLSAMPGNCRTKTMQNILRAHAHAQGLYAPAGAAI